MDLGPFFQAAGVEAFGAGVVGQVTHYCVGFPERPIANGQGRDQAEGLYRQIGRDM